MAPAIAFITLSAAAFCQENADCLGCHSDSSLSALRNGKPVSLHVREAALKATAHGQLQCIDCHSGIDMNKTPHRPKPVSVDCLTCHSDAASQHTTHKPLLPTTACKDCHGTHMSPSLNGSCGTCHSDVAAMFARSAHGRALAAGVDGAPFCFACHQKEMVVVRNGHSLAELKIGQEKMCLSCHVGNRKVARRTIPGANFVSSYTKSVHSKELYKGNGKAANCVDCHGAHEMEKGISPSAKVNKRHIPETCGRCHSEIAKQYGASIHGAALAKGNLDSPVCTDCHGEHNILSPTDPRSPVAPRNLSAQVCGTCHGSVRMSEKYGIRSDRFQSFADSYHGLAIRGGDVKAANCASCHGAHDIKPSSDPTSSVNKKNVPKTCGKCHPGANKMFAVGKVHVTVTPKQQPLLYVISLIYILLIVGTIGGMLAHNFLDLFKKWRRHVETHDLHGLYVRMSVSERIQHALLALSFIVLVVTGFMLHFPDAWWVASIRNMSRHFFDLRSLLHRISGLVLIGASIYHLIYITWTARGRQLVRDLMPRKQDALDVVQMIKYGLGMASEKPKFGRFGYIEKSEYWALIWGTVIMSVTGIIMWLDNTFIGLLSKLGWDVARTIHFYEAVLATLAIIVWHFYFVIFNPDVYPMNAAWLTGTLPEDVVEEEHPLEYEELKKRMPGREHGPETKESPDEQ